MNASSPDSDQRKPHLWEALFPVGSLVVLIFFIVIRLGCDPQVPLILAGVVAALLGLRLGYRWNEIQEGIVEGITIAMQAILILLAVGILIGTWIVSGVIPLMIYYGLEWLSAEVFLVAACLICGVASLATGSSWTTVGTVGVVLVGIAEGLGISLAMAAGAIVSGAYFGDKMSPLSDSTNLAPAVAGSNLFEHIRHMVYTTVPAFVIAVVIYAAMGFFASGGQVEMEQINLIQKTLAESFRLNPLLLLPPLLVVVMVAFRVPPLPALLIAAAAGAIIAIFFQETSLSSVLGVAQSGYVSETGVTEVDKLLSRGGLDDMMWTISLIICALGFGGIMEKTGMLAVIGESILSLARTTGQLIAATVATCVGMNIVAPDQYLSIIVPGRMYRGAFASRSLDARNLSRTLEDAGTLSSPLVPWNTCGAFVYGALGVSALSYAPFAFLNLLTPIVAIILGFTGWTIREIKNDEGPKSERMTNPE